MLSFSSLTLTLTDFYSSLLIQIYPFVLPSFLVLSLLLLIYLTYELIRFMVFLNLANEKFSILELQPLKRTTITPYTTQQLFNVIHGLTRQRSFPLQILNLFNSDAFEIVSSKEGGIRYLIRIPDKDKDLVQKTLISYLPGIQVKVVNEYLNSLANHSRVTSFRLARHYAYPLLHQDSLETYDPIGYLTGSMTKVTKDDLFAFQIVLSPLKKSTVPAISRITKLINSNKNLIGAIERGDHTLLSRIIYSLLQIFLLPVGLVVFIASNGNEGPLLSVNNRGNNEKTPNPYQTELEGLIKNKLGQQLFRVSIRLLATSNSLKELSQRERSFSSALSTLTNAEYQSLIPSHNLKIALLQRLKLWLFEKRLVMPNSSLILSTAEVADLYHLPHTYTTKTEDLTKQQSKELPAPLSLKRAGVLDIMFAKNTYGGNTTTIGMTQDERRRHVYILGATGTGKSTMLLSMLKQDIESNKGLCLIDPHGDLVDQVLSIIPKNRIKDVVYFNPDDIGYPMGINLLELTPGLSPDDTIREKEFIAESIISVFHKIYSDKYSGPRMEYILRNTIHTAFTVPGATLFTVYKLLINTPFRKQVVRGITEDNLKDFWKYEFSKAGDYQKVKMISPITNKIGRFLFSPTAKRILEQSHSTVSFDDIMNGGKILLCNLSKGKIGEDNSSVFGVLIMAKVQLAALKRARLKQEDRKDFYLYVDEFQNFATPAFSQILSEARKYRLNAILAHQTTSQIEDNSLVNVTLANTGTVICFRTANPEDERVILPQFRPYVELGEIASLPSYHFYMRLGALNPDEPFSGVTTPVTIEFSQNRVEAVINSSRKLYTTKYVPELIKTPSISQQSSAKHVYATLP